MEKKKKTCDLTLVCMLAMSTCGLLYGLISARYWAGQYQIFEARLKQLESCCKNIKQKSFPGDFSNNSDDVNFDFAVLKKKLVKVEDKFLYNETYKKRYRRKSQSYEEIKSENQLNLQSQLISVCDSLRILLKCSVSNVTSEEIIGTPLNIIKSQVIDETSNKNSPGPKGEKGEPGKDGVNGLPGTSWIEGPRGRPSDTSLKGDPGNYDYKYSQKEYSKAEQKKEFGLVYTIWGSAACPDTSNLIYSGQISMSKLAQMDGTTSGSNAVCLPISDRYSSKHTNIRTKRSVFRENITHSNYDASSISNKKFLKSTDQTRVSGKNLSNETNIGVHSNATPILREKITNVLFNQVSLKDLSKSASYSQVNKSSNSKNLSSNLIKIRNDSKEAFWNLITFTNQTIINFNINNKSNHKSSEFPDTKLEEQTTNITSSSIINHQDHKIQEQKKISVIYKNTTQNKHINKVNISQNNKLENFKYASSIITVSHDNKKLKGSIQNGNATAVHGRKLYEKKSSSNNFSITVSREKEKIEERKHNLSKVAASQVSEKLSNQNYNISNITVSRESAKLQEQQHNLIKINISQDSENLSAQSFNISNVTVSRESAKLQEQKHNLIKINISQDSENLSAQSFNISNVTVNHESANLQEQKHNVSKVNVSEDSKNLNDQSYNISNATVSHKSEKQEEKKYNISEVNISQETEQLSNQIYNGSNITVNHEKIPQNNQKYNFSKVTSTNESKVTSTNESKKVSDQKDQINNVSNSQELKNFSQEILPELDKYRESQTKTPTGPKTNEVLKPTKETNEVLKPTEEAKKYWKSSETTNMTSRPQLEDLKSNNKENMFYKNSKTAAQEIPSKNNYAIGNKADGGVNVEISLDYAKLVGTRKYVACALCQAPGKSVQIMIPTASECPPEWNVEYLGYLMNYHHGTRHSQIMCVNEQALGISPESEHEAKKIISSYLSHVKIDCETHPCNDNLLNEKLKCVVCSK